MSAETVDQRVVWDSAEPGAELPMHDGFPCTIATDDLLYACTRQVGHHGQHVATAARIVVAVWPPARAGHPEPSLDTLLARRDRRGEHLRLTPRGLIR